MLRQVAFWFCFVMLPMAAAAQPSAIPKATLEELSKDLAKLQAAVMDAQTALQSQHSAIQAPSGDPTLAVGSPEWKAMMTRSIADTVVIAVPSTKIRAGADSKAMWIADGSKGMKFPIIDRAGDWYAVGLPEPAKGFKTGWVNAENVVPERSTNLFTAATVKPVSADNSADVILLKLTEMASSLKQKYEANPYVTVTGFTFNAAVPPSVSVNFEFKKK